MSKRARASILVAMAEVQAIVIERIDANPWQPRKVFRAEDLHDLASSIRQHGVLQPLIVAPAADGRYRLIAGERRWRAAQQAGLQTVPAIVRQATNEESLELALIENVQRQDLNPLERARGYDELIRQFKLTQDQVASTIGKSRAAVANTLRLLKLPEAIQQAIADGRLSEGHAKIIAGLDTLELQMRFFERVVATNASVRETEDAARRLARKSKRPAASALSSGHTDVDEYRRLLEGAFGTKVAITERRGKGAIRVEFYSSEELGEIVKKILGR